MSNSKLATSGVTWGLSCEVSDEASMGVILGHMRLFGATNIGFEPTGLPKNPKRVIAGRKGGKAPKKGRRATAGRQPLEAAAKDALRNIDGADFTWKAFVVEMYHQGWERKPSLQRAITALLKAKLVKRKSRGRYVKLPTLVKAA